MRGAGRVVVTLIVLAAVACGEKPDGSVAEKDILYFRTPNGVAVLAAGAGEAPTSTDGVPSTDWSSVVLADSRPSGTDVAAFDVRGGDVQWSRSIEGLGRLQVKVVSEKAEMVALAPIRQRYYSLGRSKTTLVVAGRKTEPRAIDLDGNYEPEAFSTDGNSVFLLEYLPPRNPTSYRVRRLDLSTEEVLGVYSVDAELQEAMRGTARIQAMSPDGKFLYTLYTTGGGRLGPRRAFIHVLNLEELWAHCIDLPPQFGQGQEPEIAITVTPNGKRLYVTETGSGAIAAVDTQSLDVLDTGTTDMVSTAYSPKGVHDGEHTLYVARGPALTAIDTNTLEQGETWIMDATIRGVQVSADASKLYVALTRRVLTIDAATGRELEVSDPPGIGRIHEMGQGTRKVEQPPIDKLTCAC